MVSDQDRKMTSHVIDWKTEIGDIAGPFLPSDTKESWLGRAHSALRKMNSKISFRHVRSIYYGHVKDPKFSVASSILTAADQARLQEARRNVELATKFYREHAERLAAIDADHHREQINELVSAAHEFGARDRA